MLPIGTSTIPGGGFTMAITPDALDTSPVVFSKRCYTCDTEESKDVSAIPPLHCAGCKSALYCNRECQRADWKNHKPHCLHQQQDRARKKAYEASQAAISQSASSVALPDIMKAFKNFRQIHELLIDHTAASALFFCPGGDDLWIEHILCIFFSPNFSTPQECTRLRKGKSFTELARAFTAYDFQILHHSKMPRGAGNDDFLRVDYFMQQSRIWKEKGGVLLKVAYFISRMGDQVQTGQERFMSFGHMQTVQYPSAAELRDSGKYQPNWREVFQATTTLGLKFTE